MYVALQIKEDCKKMLQLSKEVSTCTSNLNKFGNYHLLLQRERAYEASAKVYKERILTLLYSI